MSVPKNLRSQGKLIVQTKAYDFASYTHQICSNEKVFLKRNRWCSTMKIVQVCDEIAVNVEIANNIDIRKGNEESLRKRRQYQNLAIEKSIELECLMEISYRDNNRNGRNLPDEKMDKYKGEIVMRVYTEQETNERKTEELNLKAEFVGETNDYAVKVNRLIREKYSLSDELAILRKALAKLGINDNQLDEYNAFIETCKEKAKEEDMKR